MSLPTLVVGFLWALALVLNGGTTRSRQVSARVGLGCDLSLALVAEFYSSDVHN